MEVCDCLFTGPFKIVNPEVILDFLKAAVLYRLFKSF